MRLFQLDDQIEVDRVFFKQPIDFTKYTPKEQLRYCVGAALYMPAIKQSIAADIINRKFSSLTSIVIDLEDALGDLQVAAGKENLVKTFRQLDDAMKNGQLTIEQLPLLFMRVRSPQQLKEMIELLGDSQHVLTGYVLPKFTASNGRAFLELVAQQNELGYCLYAMPILESADIMYKETRLEALLQIKTILTEYYDYILNIRVGATDFSGLYGIRRKVNTTIYDIAPVRDCLTDIINLFNRADMDFVLSGPVWEYFSSEDSEIATNVPLQGLIREVQLDQLNGLIGKTIIHPTHITAVNALYVVTHEEYLDAVEVLHHSNGQIGVKKSAYNNKMNEMNPHVLWAQRISMRAQVYGVYNPQVNYLSLLMGQVKA
ncbi:HpcH/HpaI aldolase/citrate lyase family protein [Solibacillus sp. FSL H8-0538]|uniref:HpcH/HpaI aldolase/citrate lyase family protein n=1 Tax=Solibacillus sp. FSL H8-0538 TaxID=2921400 RepID=UPI0030FB9E5F